LGRIYSGRNSLYILKGEGSSPLLKRKKERTAKSRRNIISLQRRGGKKREDRTTLWRGKTTSSSAGRGGGTILQGKGEAGLLLHTSRRNAALKKRPSFSSPERKGKGKSREEKNIYEKARLADGRNVSLLKAGTARFCGESTGKNV